MRQIPPKAWAWLKELEERVEVGQLMVQDIYEEADAYQQERSERWQDSDAGTHYSEWVAAIEGLLLGLNDLADSLADLAQAPEKGE